MTDPTASTPADGARAEGREPLFCVHVLGPDDVYAAPDRLTAFRWAAALNSAALPFNQDADDDRYVICHANVELWDGTADEHAEALPQAIKLMAPRRGVIPPGQVVEIDYTNHEGRRAVRKIKPTGRMLVGLDRWHPEAPWLIEARDIERNVMRTFDPAKIHRWGAALVAPAAGAGHALVPVEWPGKHDGWLRPRIGAVFSDSSGCIDPGRAMTDQEIRETYPSLNSASEVAAAPPAAAADSPAVIDFGIGRAMSRADIVDGLPQIAFAVLDHGMPIGAGPHDAPAPEAHEAALASPSVVLRFHGPQGVEAFMGQMLDMLRMVQHASGITDEQIAEAPRPAPAPPAGRAPAGVDVAALVDDLWAHARSAEAKAWSGSRHEHDAAEAKARETRAALLSAIADRDRELDALRDGGARGGVSVELIALSEAATKGPWEMITSGPQANLRQVWHDGQNAFVCETGDLERADTGPADAAFIVAAVNDLRARIEAEGRPGRAGGEG